MQYPASALRLAATLAGMCLVAQMSSSYAHSRRTLTFQDRLMAQEAIERVGYSHQIGARRPFNEAVPTQVIAEKVRAFMEHSAALEQVWATPITADALRAELERITKHTRFPGRLQEIYEALGNDPVTIGECFVRPILAERLARNFFAADERIHGAARRAAEALREDLIGGRVQADEEHPSRRVVRLNRSTPDRAAGEEGHLRGEPAHELSPGDFGRERSRLPREVGEVGRIREEAGGFTIAVVTHEEDGFVQFAEFVVPKVTWAQWWRQRDGGPGSRVSQEPETVAATADIGPVLRGLPGDAGDEAGRIDALSCGAENVWDNGTLDNPGPGDSLHSVVWTGEEMIVWGGSDNFEPVHTGSRYHPLTDTWQSMSDAGAPGDRHWHSAVWTGSLMIVWGGRGPSGEGLLSGGRYDPVTDTWAPVSSENAPENQTDNGASLVWTGAEMIIWGGWGDTTVLATGGAYDPVADAWRATTLNEAPEPRGYHSAVWTGSEMIVWGGGTEDRQLDSGSRYDPAMDHWTPITPAGAPVARSDHQAVWTGSVMVVWGGMDWDGNLLDSGGRYDPAADAWSPTSLVGVPEARYAATATWTGSQMIVWGGENDIYLSTGGLYDPVLDSWSATSTLNAPAPRSNHKALWTGSLMIIYGGGGQATGGRYDPATDTWTPTSLISGPHAANVAVWTGNQMLIWGWQADPGARYDPLVDLWTPITSTGAPAPRGGPAAGVWSGESMIVWGGDSLSTGGKYDPISDSWAAMSSANAPSTRYSHTAVWTGNRMIVWGGAWQQALNSGGIYDPAADTWSPTSVIDAPSGRTQHTAVWTGTEMIIWGGGNTGGRYNPSTNSWRRTSTAGAPFIYGHAGVWTGDRMIVWGEHAGVAAGGVYAPGTDTWVQTSGAGAPSPRYDHTAAWTGREMLVWGGYAYQAGVPLDTGALYNPVANTWSPTPMEGAPAPRARVASFRAGSMILIWSSMGDGGRFVPDASPDQDLDGISLCGGDCDDSAPGVYPGAPQICDGVNNDCSDPSWPALPGAEMDDDGDAVTECQGDCDDMAVSVFPGAAQICDGLNNDCSHPSWPGMQGTNETDDDGDAVAECQGDCEDANPSVHPGAPQTCDGLNNDCDDPLWPVLPAHETDQDGDSFSLCGADCDEGNSRVYPGAPQLCDEINNDCDDPQWPVVAAREIDNHLYPDQDGDGAGSLCDCTDQDSTVYPGAAELNDGMDNQCAGDPGHGAIDELSGALHWISADTYCWQAQQGASQYEIAVSDDPLFDGCVILNTSGTCANDVLAGQVRFYLVRARLPFIGSWGQNSSGEERTNLCSGQGARPAWSPQ